MSADATERDTATTLLLDATGGHTPSVEALLPLVYSECGTDEAGRQAEALPSGSRFVGGAHERGNGVYMTSPSRERSGRGYGRTWMLPATISFNGERKDWTTPRGCVQAKSTTD